ncbi:MULTISPECIES: sugar MFS transporter [unclassified Sphingomonas]|uniref:sugar MFS transporter n=1 Tax=unclassified Sphingomonas TaxID=196159 RepID=UPI0006FBB8F0|nr:MULTISPECIES: sugar MFS transporter [unclassified Sphingomonas]KQX23610.1 glucose transporter [Sphingomonas sp. Root1294]KQY68457.1 glucose transporter [Sphingomonas sp. Root50]KRB91316.1 glucose transporter [Sphingomonas sp. Root720]
MGPAPVSAATAEDEAPAQATGSLVGLRWFVFALFFIFGGITSLNDVLIPKLKGLFTLSYHEAMLVQSAFFAAYFIISLPAALIVQRMGYMRTASIGLLTMMGGCLLFIPASSSGTFSLFLMALFVLGSGITIVQVVANPLISMLGAARTAHSRLTFAQAFNSLGTTIFPPVGSIVILGSLATVDPQTLSGAALEAFRIAETRTIVHTYIALAAALLIIAAVVWLGRNQLREKRSDDNILAAFGLLARPRFAFGTLGIFLYVGAEVSIGSFIVNYLAQGDVLGLAAEDAGKLLVFYWGGALAGRFLGAYALRVVAPARVLMAVAAGAIALILISANSTGALSGWSLLAVGLMNSIMFPTIFSLASEGLGRRAAEGSGIICMAIVGGAIVPLIAGRAADAATLRFALIVPAICYMLIALFGRYCHRHPAAPSS